MLSMPFSSTAADDDIPRQSRHARRVLSLTVFANSQMHSYPLSSPSPNAFLTLSRESERSRPTPRFLNVMTTIAPDALAIQSMMSRQEATSNTPIYDYLEQRRFQKGRRDNLCGRGIAIRSSPFFSSGKTSLRMAAMLHG